jgi:hypothetical protein
LNGSLAWVWIPVVPVKLELLAIDTYEDCCSYVIKKKKKSLSLDTYKNGQYLQIQWSVRSTSHLPKKEEKNGEFQTNTYLMEIFLKSQTNTKVKRT